MPAELKQVIEEQSMMTTATFKVWRSDDAGGIPRTTRSTSSPAWSCSTPSTRSRRRRRLTWRCRWNCKAGKCGSCSAEINGNPRLMCMTRLNSLPLDRAGDRRADAGLSAHQGSRHRRLLELSGSSKTIKPFTPRPADAPDGTWRMLQKDVDRVQEFRKCIECFLCQDVCHVLRDHHMHDEFIGPRFLIYAAALEMHPLDVGGPGAGAQGRARHRLLQHHASAAPRSVPSTSRSPTTRSSRSRSGSSIGSTIPSTRLLRIFRS